MKGPSIRIKQDTRDRQRHHDHDQALFYQLERPCGMWRLTPVIFNLVKKHISFGQKLSQKTLNAKFRKRQSIKFDIWVPNMHFPRIYIFGAPIALAGHVLVSS